MYQPDRNLRERQDVRIQIALGQFYAAKLRAGVLFEIYRRTGEAQAREQSVASYRRARSTWAAMAERARKVYVADLSYGETPVRRGHWMDRLPAIDQDLAAAEAAHFEGSPQPADRVLRAIAQATGRPVRTSLKCRHNLPKGFRAGSTVTLGITVEGDAPAVVRLHYRRVNQAERWQSLDMKAEAGTFQCAIPGAYTQSPFPLQYYFEVRPAKANATLYPGFDAAFNGQPYFVLERG
jgi:hypothetical protein